jgi:glycosyltransferase involved in cell wall biosynthesis
VEELKPGKKKNIILNVGRFFVGGHSKRQDILVSTFKSMIDEGKIKKKSWELNLVGGITGGKEHTDFGKNLREEARGYPIKFHFSASFSALKKLYAEAKIYWHATGFGVNESIEPIKMEHFGITPIEAMAAGAVPLVYKGGGLSETVGEDSNLVWKSKEELIQKTLKLINSPKLLAKLSKTGSQKAYTFSRANFAKNLINYLDLHKNEKAR